MIGDYAVASREQALEAVAAAHAAFPAWSLSTPSSALTSWTPGNEIIARKAELGDLLAREEGKPCPKPSAKWARAAAIFKFFAGEAPCAPVASAALGAPGVGVEITREPLGVIGLITPGTSPSPSPPGRLPRPGLRQHRGVQTR